MKAGSSSSSPSAAAAAALATAPATAASLELEKHPLQHQQHRQWNTKHLSWRIGVDAFGAACAGALVAPVISIIDRSIMENASGRSSLVESIQLSLRNLVRHPRSALLSKPCALIFMLYGSTYLTANLLDTATSSARNQPASSVSAGAAKFAASSAANVGLCMYKDRSFVRMFGPAGAAPRPVPLPSYALFALRDCLTIFASFNVPPLLAPWLDARLAHEVRSRLSGQTAAQFMAPAAVQFLSTPLHLLGLDLYNRPSGGGGGGGVSWQNRLAAIRANWLISSAARICRIVPAFGVGGVVNTKVRRNLMTKLE